MSFSYWLLSFIVMVGLPLGFWALHQYLFNNYIYKMKAWVIILIHSSIAVLWTLLSWIYPSFGWLCFILTLGSEFLVVWYIIHKSSLGKLLGV